MAVESVRVEQWRVGKWNSKQWSTERPAIDNRVTLWISAPRGRDGGLRDGRTVDQKTGVAA